jgi:hypothetical protein
MMSSQISVFSKYYRETQSVAIELQIWASGVCRFLPPRQQLSVSLMEKFLGFGGENSQTSKLAGISSKVFAKTDTEIVHASGR